MLAQASAAVVSCFPSSSTPLPRFEPSSFLPKADTRSDKHDSLGLALLQHQHIGVLPSTITNGMKEEDNYNDGPRLLQTQMSTSMPSSWVRGAILVRANSLIRGHSAIRWHLITSMADLLNENVTPVCIMLPYFLPLLLPYRPTPCIDRSTPSEH